MHVLYGDGVHDDTCAIQELIDSGKCEVSLPTPEKFYLISRTLVMPSNFRLVLPRFAEIRLADGSNCPMLKNKTVYDPAPRLPDYLDPAMRHIANHIDDCSPDHPCRNIEVVGGIWNCNNMGQRPNPVQTGDFSIREFTGVGMLFYNIKGFKLSSLTLKDVTTFGIVLDKVSYFTAEDITFDYNFGNPVPINMDGIHLNGGCRFGVIRNLKGACYDDLVALNADEGCGEPITDIDVNGIFAEECHSAVRLLCARTRVENIHISDIHGTYYQYCIGISKYYPGEAGGGYGSISADHIYASKAIRHPYLYPWPKADVPPLIWIESGCVIENLTVSELVRRENNVAVDTVFVSEGAVIDSLVLRDVVTENHTGSPRPLLTNNGTIRRLSISDVISGDDEVLSGTGKVESLCEYK